MILEGFSNLYNSEDFSTWRASGVCPLSTQWERGWLQVTQSGEAAPEQRIRIENFWWIWSRGHEGRGDRSGQTSAKLLCATGSALHVQGEEGKGFGWSSEVKEHFPWGETEQTAWRGNEGFQLHVRETSAWKIQVTLPLGRKMHGWFLDVISSPIFLWFHHFLQNYVGFGCTRTETCSIHPLPSPVLLRESEQSSSNSAWCV